MEEAEYLHHLHYLTESNNMGYFTEEELKMIGRAIITAKSTLHDVSQEQNIPFSPQMRERIKDMNDQCESILQKIADITGRYPTLKPFPEDWQLMAFTRES